MNHLIYIIMDSCRFDSCQQARTPNLDRLGAVERRYSYASWTSPSHYAMLMGMIPHTSPRGVFASEVYKGEFKRWVERLGIEGLSFKSFVPELSLPRVLRSHGYATIARVSLPVLNPYTLLSRDFDDYRLMDNHNDFAGMVAEIAFPDARPRFYFLNLGETHYPYMLSGENLPHISGVHGVLKHLDSGAAAPDAGEQVFFPPDEMQRLHRQQVKCVEYLDGLLGALYAKCPANTHFIVTADHGELFGEEGYFGHGPIMHEKCFEVPFVEGLRP
ncbi:MAG TPA: sulfatase-like hydrolase/transferase [Candidatus Competibacteraceae bacterium]|nr:MAG: metalloenzyme [Candidatus Competibacteraceae bacterium]HQC73088.1 sulfatase-like hydrolase/transferase [Candidatus Competibacteraceae bacterium]